MCAASDLAYALNAFEKHSEAVVAAKYLKFEIICLCRALSQLLVHFLHLLSFKEVGGFELFPAIQRETSVEGGDVGAYEVNRVPSEVLRLEDCLLSILAFFEETFNDVSDTIVAPAAEDHVLHTQVGIYDIVCESISSAMSLEGYMKKV